MIHEKIDVLPFVSIEVETADTWIEMCLDLSSDPKYPVFKFVEFGEITSEGHLLLQAYIKVKSKVVNQTSLTVPPENWHWLTCVAPNKVGARFAPN